MTARVPAGVAAGHEVTATVGLETLRAGGNAADAACSMILAGCVAETIFTGLGGGGFATYFDATTKTVTCHDFFVAVPGLDGSPLSRGAGISVLFSGVPMAYDVGGPTVAVPGTPAGVEQLHRQHGSMRWRDVVQPAVGLAASGTPFSQAHADLLPEVQAAFLLGAGVEIYSVSASSGSSVSSGASASAGAATAERRLLQAAEQLFHEGLADTFAGYAAEGSDYLTQGDFAGELVALARTDGGALSLLDLAAYRPIVTEPRAVEFGTSSVHLRGDDLDDMTGTLRRLDLDAVHAGSPRREVALADALRGPARRSDTTALVAVDADGNVCVASHSLGLGSGVWVRGVHANSMLGEGELLRGELTPGHRLGSMMTPLIATDPAREVLLAAASAGGSRIRSALLQVATAVLYEQVPVNEAVHAPRIAVIDSTVHYEPGFADVVPGALADAGYLLKPWVSVKPYFGGVAAAGRTGLAADPRRSGYAFQL